MRAGAVARHGIRDFSIPFTAKHTGIRRSTATLSRDQVWSVKGEHHWNCAEWEQSEKMVCTTNYRRGNPSTAWHMPGSFSVFQSVIRKFMSRWLCDKVLGSLRAPLRHYFSADSKVRVATVTI